MAVLTTIALSGAEESMLGMTGFAAAFSVAAVVALGTAALGATLVRR